MKIIKLLVFTFIFCSSISNAQEVKIDKNKVLINNKEVLKYEKLNFDSHSFYSLDDNEIILFKYNDNETPKYANDDYIVLNFLAEKIKIESKETDRVLAGLGLSTKKNMEKLISWLLKEKVLDVDGNLNNERIQVFNQKYNENITERTVR